MSRQKKNLKNVKRKNNITKRFRKISEPLCYIASIPFYPRIAFDIYCINCYGHLHETVSNYRSFDAVVPIQLLPLPMVYPDLPSSPADDTSNRKFRRRFLPALHLARRKRMICLIPVQKEIPKMKKTKQNRTKTKALLPKTPMKPNMTTMIIIRKKVTGNQHG